MKNISVIGAGATMMLALAVSSAPTEAQAQSSRSSHCTVEFINETIDLGSERGAGFLAALNDEIEGGLNGNQPLGDPDGFDFMDPGVQQITVEVEKVVCADTGPRNTARQGDVSTNSLGDPDVDDVFPFPGSNANNGDSMVLTLCNPDTFVQSTYTLKHENGHWVVKEKHSIKLTECPAM